MDEINVNKLKLLPLYYKISEIAEEYINKQLESYNKKYNNYKKDSHTLRMIKDKIDSFIDYFKHINEIHKKENLESINYLADMRISLLLELQDFIKEVEND